MDDNVGLYNLLGSEILPRAIDLPPPDTKRWVARRKAVICQRRTQRRHKSRGSLPALRAVGGRIPRLATRDRDPRGSRFTRHPAADLPRHPSCSAGQTSLLSAQSAGWRPQERTRTFGPQPSRAEPATKWARADGPGKAPQQARRSKLARGEFGRAAGKSGIRIRRAGLILFLI